MPDLGGLGRGLLKGARSATDKAGDAVRRPRDDEKDEPRPEPADAAEPDDDVAFADEPEEHADDSEAAELIEQLRSLVDSRRPAPGPITQRWSLGVGDLLSVHPKVPKRLRGLTRRLDRFGGIAIAPDTIAFDGDDVDWSDVTEVRTRHWSLPAHHPPTPSPVCRLPARRRRAAAGGEHPAALVPRPQAGS